MSDIICPDSAASTSISNTAKSWKKSSGDLLGPLDLGVESEENSLSSLTHTPDLDLTRNDLEMAMHEADLCTLAATPPLDLCWDLLCDVNTYQVSMCVLVGVAIRTAPLPFRESN